MSTLDALENARMGELVFVSVARILAVLGLQLKLQETVSNRPTPDELVEEDRLDQVQDEYR
jgi:hypothetical protein